MVILSHYFTLEIQSGNSNAIYKTVSSLGGSMGLAIFFFLSGYGLMQSELRKPLTVWQFCRRRLSKVYVPVVLVTAIWLVAEYFFKGMLFDNWQHIVYILFWGFDDGALWFIKVIITLYATFGVFAFLRGKNNALALYVFAILIIGVYFLTGRYIGDFAPRSVPLFFLGVICSLYPLDIKKLLVSLILIFVMTAIEQYITGGDTFLVKTIINLILIVGLLSLFCTNMASRIVLPAFLGSLSFDIYLVHNKVIDLIRNNIICQSFWIWAITTLILSVVFYYIRNGIIRDRIKVKHS